MDDSSDPAATLAAPADDSDTAPVDRHRSALLEPRTSEPTRIGRFIVLRLLGQGGMGRVYVAFDERLDRRVAIKVLRPFRSGLDAGVRARVAREAKAMAKLSHPNVVQVFEVGEHRDELFVAMEFVDGVTLEAWQAIPGRRWTHVLQAYRQAGEGLIAAHAAGLVHRDFKPQNVMVDDDGDHMRVRVLDFGLARPLGEQTPSQDLETSSELTTADDRLTATGIVLGTPAYMAPEQFSTAAVDHSADQFSFCVSLWEGLYGGRPFAATGYSLVDSVMQGRLREPPRDSPVPAWVRVAVTRGLALSPADRWPSMRALLDALAKDPAQQRRQWIQRIGAVALVGMGTAGAMQWLGDDSEECTGASQQLTGVWDEAQRSEIEAAILGTNVSFAPDTWQSIAAVLDAYAQSWTTMHTEACEATTVRGEQSVEVMDLRMACLQRTLGGLRAVTNVLADADAKVVQNAYAIVAELAPLSRCADVDALRADAEPPREQDASAVASARASLADAEAQNLAGRYREAEHAIDEAAGVLEHVDYPPAQIELAIAQSDTLAQAARYADAEAALTRALELGTQTFHRESIQTAASKLLYLVGRQPKRTTEALQRYRMLAEVLAAGDPSREASVHKGLGNLLETEGKYEEAVAEHRKALALHEAEAEQNPLGVANARNELGNALIELGRYADAEAEFRRATEIFERTLGPRHPSIAMSRANTSTVLSMQGEYEEAEAEARAALKIREDALGPESPDVAVSLGDLAGSLYWQGEYDEAARHVRRALAIEEKLLGPEDVRVAKSHNNLGLLLQAQGKFAEAEVEERRALELKEGALGRDHPEVASGRTNLAVLLQAQRRYAEAEEQQREALRVYEIKLGAAHPEVDRARLNLARILVELGRFTDALAIAEDAWTRRSGKDVTAADRALAGFVLARALWDGDRSQRARAHELATAALADYVAAGPHLTDEVDNVREWLRGHALR